MSRITRMMRLGILASFLAALTFLPSTATAAGMTCFCKVSAGNLSGVCHPSASQTLVDLTGAVGTQYNWPRTNTKWQSCQQKCADAANAAKGNIAAAACAAGIPNGTVIRAYGALGNCGSKGEYSAAGTLGELVNTPAVTQTACTCPQGWTSNAPKCDTSVDVNGIHYTSQTCAQSRPDFETTAINFFTSKCAAPSKLVAIQNIVCKDTPIPGFPNPGGSVYSATACCGQPGVTVDGRCKALACQPNTVTPYPPNGMAVGTAPPTYGTSAMSWGFSWGNAFYAWGTAANGGAPTNCQTSVLTPAMCKFK